MKEPAIIFDLDGTLADVTIRQRHLEGGKKDWKSFFATIKTDTLNVWCRELVEALRSKYRIIIVSGRIDTLKQETEEWLKQHQVHYDALYLRDKNDHRDDQVLKREIYETYIQPKFDVLFVVDDRKKVVKMWREIGLVCLHCAEGDF